LKELFFGDLVVSKQLIANFSRRFLGFDRMMKIIRCPGLAAANIFEKNKGLTLCSMFKDLT
jgi:hypothetical protein